MVTSQWYISRRNTFLVICPMRKLFFLVAAVCRMLSHNGHGNLYNTLALLLVHYDINVEIKIRIFSFS